MNRRGEEEDLKRKMLSKTCKEEQAHKGEAEDRI
jgi:hypothetical protein